MNIFNSKSKHMDNKTERRNLFRLQANCAAKCLLVLAMMLSGCSSTQKEKGFSNTQSYLEGVNSTEGTQGRKASESAENQQGTEPLFETVSPLVRSKIGFKTDVSMAQSLSASKQIKMSAETMNTVNFIHYAFGDLLKLNYILGQGLDELDSKVSINVQESVSERRLFTLAEQLLAEQQISVQQQGDLLYISLQVKQGEGAKSVGYGRGVDSVPDALNVIQIVPLKYIPQGNFLEPIRQVTRAKTSLDASQGVVFLSGDRQEVVRAVELLNLLDAPGSIGRHVGLRKLTYISVENFIESVTSILQNEGLIAPTGRKDKRIGFVDLGQLGAVAIFASEQAFLKRVNYWAQKLDRPSEGSQKRYYIYEPEYARASDLGESVKALITGRSSSNTANQQAARNSQQRVAEIENANRSAAAVSGDGMRMVVDERSNSLIFYTSGMEYRALLPLIKRLDVLPKQIMLELVVAEVTLSDEFKFGVDVALRSGKFVASNNFGAVSSVAGSALSWINGLDRVDVRAFESNNHVNVLSRPSLLVRDGISANIQVGNQIPVVGQTTTDPTTGTTRSVDYRKTGIELSVTPTVNAQGVVIMSIEQSNSNQVDGGTVVEGNPQIFERSIKTEVVAESGQTVVLGGLISESNTDNDSGLPGLHKLPVIGALFGVKTERTTKTELVVMVTPRIIARTDEWDGIKQQLQQGLEHLQLQP